MAFGGAGITRMPDSLYKIGLLVVAIFLLRLDFSRRPRQKRLRNLLKAPLPLNPLKTSNLLQRRHMTTVS